MLAHVLVMAVTAGLGIIVVFFALLSITGVAAQINVSGSQRTRAVLISSFATTRAAQILERQEGLVEPEDLEELRDQGLAAIDLYEQTIRDLRQGNPNRGLRPTQNVAILALIDEWESAWMPFRDDARELLDVDRERPSYSTVPRSNARSPFAIWPIGSCPPTRSSSIVAHASF